MVSWCFSGCCRVLLWIFLYKFITYTNHNQSGIEILTTYELTWSFIWFGVIGVVSPILALISWEICFHFWWSVPSPWCSMDHWRASLQRYVGSLGAVGLMVASTGSKKKDHHTAKPVFDPVFPRTLLCLNSSIVLKKDITRRSFFQLQFKFIVVFPEVQCFSCSGFLCLCTFVCLIYGNKVCPHTYLPKLMNHRWMTINKKGKR